MKRWWLAIMVVLAVFTFSNAVQANTIALSDPYNRYSNGGPFTAKVVENIQDGLVGDLISGGIQFTTFCLERNEFFSWNSIYNYTIDDHAYKGGVGGHTGTDTDDLSNQSAYLYYRFRTDLNFANSNVKKQALQAAFWYLEDEQGSNGYGSVWNLQATPSMYTADWWAWEYINEANRTNFDNNGRVVVLNLYSNNVQSQSQLGLKAVPEPTTLLLLGLGLVGLGLSSRKLRKRK